MTTFFEPEPRAAVHAPRRGFRTALTIAGLDPSGGAGIVADVRTFTALGVWPLAVAATLTYQSTRGMTGRYDVPKEVVLRQLEELFADRNPNAVKTGALGGGGAAKEAGLFLDAVDYRGVLVVDPVLSATSGGALIEEEALEALARYLLPRATIVTPNASEAAEISGFEVEDLQDAEAAALRITSMGPRAAFITGVKVVSGGSAAAADVFCDREEIEVFRSPWREGLRVHGTGCVLSAALAACLAGGMALKEAARFSHRFTGAAIAGALATGTGPPSALPGAPAAASQFNGPGSATGGPGTSRNAGPQEGTREEN